MVNGRDAPCNADPQEDVHRVTSGHVPHARVGVLVLACGHLARERVCNKITHLDPPPPYSFSFPFIALSLPLLVKFIHFRSFPARASNDNTWFRSSYIRTRVVYIAWRVRHMSRGQFAVYVLVKSPRSTSTHRGNVLINIGEILWKFYGSIAGGLFVDTCTSEEFFQSWTFFRKMDPWSFLSLASSLSFLFTRDRDTYTGA